jgi:hypothetical protein
MLPSKRQGSEGGEEEVWKSLRIENMELPEWYKSAPFRLFAHCQCSVATRHAGLTI